MNLEQLLLSLPQAHRPNPTEGRSLKTQSHHLLFKLCLSPVLSAVLSGILATLMLSSCGPLPAHPQASSAANDPETKKTDGKNSHNPDVAENLADEGEALLLPKTLDQAHEKFIAAVEADSENARARFWVSASELFLELKGFGRRVRPLYLQTPGGEARYEAFFGNEFNSHRNTSPGWQFVVSGQEDIRTGAEFTEWMDRVRLKVFNMRKTLKEIRDSEFNITLPKVLLNRPGDSICGLLSFGPIRYRSSDDVCGQATAGTVGLNRADFDTIGMHLSYLQLELDLWTAYRLNPLAIFASLGKQTSTQEFLELALKDADGSVSRPKPFINLREMASEALLSIRYQMENQNTLCPTGYSNPNNRKGYLISVGNCYPIYSDHNEYERTIDTVEAFLAGRPTLLRDNSILDFNELIDNPPQNIHEVLPLKFNSCGKISGMQTAKFPKIFVQIKSDGWIESRCDKEGAQ